MKNVRVLFALAALFVPALLTGCEEEKKPVAPATPAAPAKPADAKPADAKPADAKPAAK